MDGMIEFFDTLEQTDWNQSLQRTLIHWLGIQSTYRVLDAGCGAGRFATHLAQRSEWVTAVDLNPQMIERATRSASDFGILNMTFEVANLCNLPYPDASFDLVTCLDVLFMFENPEKVLQELMRVVHPGGQLVVLNPSGAMNPWSAQTLCDERQWKDFQRDSFLAWSTAAARRRLYDTHAWRELAQACGARLDDTLMLLEGLVAVYKFVPDQGAERTAQVPTELAQVDLATTGEDAEFATPVEEPQDCVESDTLFL